MPHPHRGSLHRAARVPWMWAPRVSTRARTAASLWAPRLSMTRMSPGRGWRPRSPGTHPGVPECAWREVHCAGAEARRHRSPDEADGAASALRFRPGRCRRRPGARGLLVPSRRVREHGERGAAEQASGASREDHPFAVDRLPLRSGSTVQRPAVGASSSKGSMGSLQSWDTGVGAPRYAAPRKHLGTPEVGRAAAPGRPSRGTPPAAVPLRPTRRCRTDRAIAARAWWRCRWRRRRARRPRLRG